MPTTGRHPPRTVDEVADLVPVSRETRTRLETYAALLRKWQARINLVGPDTLPDLWARHFLDSLQLLPRIPAGKQSITDLGSGAGFPGLVLAIATGLETHLVESDARKCAFLREVARVTKASVSIHTARLENLKPWQTDVITARALAPLEKLLDFAQIFQMDDKNRPICLFLKGKNIEQELTDAKKTWIMHVDRFPSLSDPMGSILRLSDVARRKSHD